MVPDRDTSVYIHVQSRQRHTAQWPCVHWWTSWTTNPGGAGRHRQCPAGLLCIAPELSSAQGQGERVGSRPGTGTCRCFITQTSPIASCPLCPSARPPPLSIATIMIKQSLWGFVSTVPSHH